MENIASPALKSVADHALKEQNLSAAALLPPCAK
jgi:hypothetical protein